MPLKVERDENDQRKEPTVSEKVAFAQAIAERLQGRHGVRLDTARGGNISMSDQGATRDIAAAEAGPRRTFEFSQSVEIPAARPRAHG